MEGTSGALRQQRVSPATQIRNWNSLLADNGLLQLEAGSRALGEGNQLTLIVGNVEISDCA